VTEYELMLKRAVEEALKPYLKALVDDAVKGLLRSIGDAGATPENVTGRTLLGWLSEIEREADWTCASLYPRNAYATSTAATLTVTLAVEYSYEGRSYVEVGVKSSASGDFYVEGSHDNATWIPIATVTIAAGEENVWKRWPVGDHARRNAFPYVRVRTDLVADNAILIVSSR